MNKAPYTIHGVLAGAYRGKALEERTLLTHASQDEAHTSVCKRVKIGMLCDQITNRPVTCSVCLERIAKRGLVWVGKMCENGCDAPVHPPSAVICKACIDKITATLEALAQRAE